jgi:voltage-gated potassium channel
MKEQLKNKRSAWRLKLYEIIFEADTPVGKGFDITLMFFILLSVIAVLLDSVPQLNQQYGTWFFIAEWFFTIVFTFEYIIRILTAKKVSSYIFSFYGIIDLLAILPTYLSLFLVGTQFLLVIRVLRLLRVFRVLKLARFIGASTQLVIAMRQSRHKIIIFLEVVMTLVVIVGSLMYLIEGPAHGFTSIPRSIYWAIVTLTTVGYGDIAPQTIVGQTLASFVMIIGYAIIAVPTGIISVEMSRAQQMHTRECSNCNEIIHDADAKYCKSCGVEL